MHAPGWPGYSSTSNACETSERLELDGFQPGELAAGLDELELSADGSTVVFNVRGPENVQLRAFAYDIATRPPDHDEDEIFDAIVRDRQTGTNELVSIADDGMKSSNHVDWTSISADGQLVGFSAFASSLSPIDDGIAPGDDDERDDIYLRDRETGDVVMVSMGLTEERGDITMADPWVSDDGQRILYTVGKNDGTGIFVDGSRTRTSEPPDPAPADERRRAVAGRHRRRRFVVLVGVDATRSGARC